MAKAALNMMTRTSGLEFQLDHIYMTGIFFFVSHTVRKSRNMNRAKEVSNFLICCINNLLEHHQERIKILHGCPFL